LSKKDKEEQKRQNFRPLPFLLLFVLFCLKLFLNDDPHCATTFSISAAAADLSIPAIYIFSACCRLR
jgi:hypothetical protein